MNPFAATALPDAELEERRPLLRKAKVGDRAAVEKLRERYGCRTYTPAECRAEEARYNAGHPATTRDDAKRGATMPRGYMECPHCGESIGTKFSLRHIRSCPKNPQQAQEEPTEPEQTLPQPSTADRPATGKRNGNGHPLQVPSETLVSVNLTAAEKALFCGLIRRGLDLDDAAASIEQARRVYGAQATQ